MLMNRPLVAIPGNREEYLNFGYCVLGRVIEKVTGVAYKDHIKSILKPMGISDMEIAGNTLADRLPHEVKYYQAEYSPYSMNVTRMDSHGGWIATATDLARILVRIDRQSSVADVVSAAVLSQMYFGDTQWYHTGSLPGTSTFMGRENDTFSFVVLANTRNENNYDQVINELYGVLITAVTARTTWPAYDLF
jgi:CubicO group peptidase (beta-lactamase class C family)